MKADCYGLGVDTCIPALRDAGCRHFFVAHWSEVAPVAVHVDPAQICVLHGPLTAEDAAYARAIGAVPVINSPDQALLWESSGGGRCHLMVDTGMNRLGVSLAQLTQPAIQALDVEVLMSHLASADEDSDLNARQLADFRKAAPLISHRVLSLANSAGIGLGADFAFDLTRPGLAVYGGVPRAELAEHIGQVAYPQAAILQVREIEAGDTVGYNATYTAKGPMHVATVSLGYADGYLRCWSGKGALIHDGRTLPLLGRVSMDMVVVDLANASDLREGDWLDVPYHLPDAAQQTPLSQYELLTILGQRLK